MRCLVLPRQAACGVGATASHDKKTKKGLNILLISLLTRAGNYQQKFVYIFKFIDTYVCLFVLCS